jgi:2-phosphosulfolactate phosphatase
VITGSLVNAAAICRFVLEQAPAQVSLVRMGQEVCARCDEDDLCAELLAARLAHREFDILSVRPRLRNEASARKFFNPEAIWAPERDFELCTDVDRFDFVLQLRSPATGLAELRAVPA